MHIAYCTLVTHNSDLVDEVKKRGRRVETNQADALFPRIAKYLGVLIEVEAPRLVPLRLDLQQS